MPTQGLFAKSGTYAPGLAVLGPFRYLSPVAAFDCITAMRALGDESRLRIVRLLLGTRLGVGQIAEAVGLTPYNVSKHLRILREAGLVESEKRRQQRLYTVAAAFSRHLEEHELILDLGCCRFDFTKLALERGAPPG